MTIKTKWKKIDKNLPKDQSMVFVATEGNDQRPNYFGAVVYQDGNFGTSQTNWTHWMYPPKLAGSDNEIHQG